MNVGLWPVGWPDGRFSIQWDMMVDSYRIGYPEHLWPIQYRSHRFLQRNHFFSCSVFVRFRGTSASKGEFCGDVCKSKN